MKKSGTDASEGVVIMHVFTKMDQILFEPPLHLIIGIKQSASLNQSESTPKTNQVACVEFLLQWLVTQ